MRIPPPVPMKPFKKPAATATTQKNIVRVEFPPGKIFMSD